MRRAQTPRMVAYIILSHPQCHCQWLCFIAAHQATAPNLYGTGCSMDNNNMNAPTVHHDSACATTRAQVSHILVVVAQHGACHPSTHRCHARSITRTEARTRSMNGFSSRAHLRTCWHKLSNQATAACHHSHPLRTARTMFKCWMNRVSLVTASCRSPRFSRYLHTQCMVREVCTATTELPQAVPPRHVSNTACRVAAVEALNGDSGCASLEDGFFIHLHKEALQFGGCEIQRHHQLLLTTTTPTCMVKAAALRSFKCLSLHRRAK